jgi:hypothetical protein
MTIVRPLSDNKVISVSLTPQNCSLFQSKADGQKKKKNLPFLKVTFI